MDATCLVCHITCTGLPITRAGPGRTWRRRLIPGNRNMTRSHQRMWGIDPCAGAHKQRRLTGIPEGSSGLPSTPCCRVWCQVGRRSHKSSYLRRFIREAASGAHLSDPPWGSELGSWSSARLALDPFLSRQMLLCFFLTAPVSRLSSYVILPARVLAVRAWGMTTAFGRCLGTVWTISPAYGVQPASQPAETRLAT